MHQAYEDITSRISEEPRWYDENGVPRYAAFHPTYCPDIYANQVVLLRIACAGAGCRREFDVEMHNDGPLCPFLTREMIHYGDPPAHHCPYGGDTMNCDDIAIIECWHRPSAGEWERHRELEGLME